MPFLGKSPTAGFASIVKDDLTPNGSTTAFTLSKQVANANDIAVFLGNVRQEPTDAYTVSGTTLTMSEAPASGLNFYVLHIAGTLESSVIPADDTISTAKLQNDSVTGAKIENNPEIAGALTTNGNITITSNTAASDGYEGYALKFRNINANNASESATYATISAESESSWGGDIVFKTKADNGTPNDSVTEHLRIDHDGHGISNFTVIAWVNCGGTSGSNETTINGSYNISSVTDAEVGANYYNYTKTQNTSYRCVTGSQNNSGWNAGGTMVTNTNDANRFRFRSFQMDTAADDSEHNVVVFGPPVTS